MFKKTLAAAMFLSLGLSTSATHAGNGSNRNEVRSKVAAGGWEVVWGVTINEAEYAKFIAATYNGAPMAYFNNYLNRNIEKFTRKAPGVAKSGLIRAIKRAFKDRGRSFRVGKIGVKAGLSTYRRWYSQKVPDGTEKYKIYGPRNPFTGKRTWTYGYRPKFKEKRISLPNHHQPFVAFRLYSTVGNSTGGGTTPSAQPVQIRYTIWNASNQTVRFRLPSGRIYSLAAGRRGSYSNRSSSPTIKILSTGRVYRLGSGNHKLFWMKSKARIGFDRNYRS